MLRSGTPPLIAQEHAAWVVSAELARAIARDAAAIAAPARKGRRAGLPVHLREIAFTAARRAIISSASSRTATARLQASLIAANRARILDALARCRITGHRHRDRKTKARLGFPHGGPGMPHAHRTSPDQRLRYHSGLTSRRPRSRAVTGNAGRGTGRCPGAPSGP